MSVMGFQKKVWMGVGGWGELYPSFFWIFIKKIIFAKLLSKSVFILAVVSCFCLNVLPFFHVFSFLPVAVSRI